MFTDKTSNLCNMKKFSGVLVMIIFCFTSCVNENADKVISPKFPGDVSKVKPMMIADSVLTLIGSPVVKQTIVMSDSGKTNLQLWEYNGYKLIMILNDTALEVIHGKKATLLTVFETQDSVLLARHLIIHYAGELK